MNDQQRADSKIDLALEADFVLGGLQLSPSRCRATNGGVEERVEPRVMEVLVYLVRNAGRTVTREGLIDACWDGRAVSDDAVARVIARLRTLGRSADPPPFTMETIPKVGFRFILNDEAAARSPAPVSNTAPQHLLANKRIITFALAAMALLIVGAWLAIGRQPAAGAIPDRVAVVAFSTLGSDPELVGLARRAQHALAQRLIVAGIPAVMVAPGGIQPAEIALRLEGSVERAGDQFVLRTFLSFHPGGLTVWSERFERNTADIAGLEEEAAYATALGFSCSLSKSATPLWRQARQATLPLLFESCFAMDTLDVERQVSAARRLVEAAPNLAFAHGMLALALAAQSTAFAHLPEQTKALADVAFSEANKALALDDDDVSAHLALGARTGKMSLVQRERHLKRALDLDPQNVTALLHYSHFLLEVGRIAAAREILGRAERWPSTAMLRAHIDAMKGDRVSAEQQLDQLASVRPAWARDGRFVITAFWEDPSTAIGKLPDLASTRPRDGDSCILGHVAAMARAEGRPFKGLPDACNGVIIDWRVRLLARQGDVDGAFSLLDAPWPVTRSHRFLFYPEMSSVRADRRFLAFAERLDLLAYWRETNRWPDFCEEPSLPYRCQ